MSEAVRLELDGSIAIVKLNRPLAANTIDTDMTAALSKLANRCASDTAIRCVILRAEGRIFCAGGDLAAFADAGDTMSQLLLDTTAQLHSAVSRLARMDKPLVTVVQGPAAGAGFSLAMLGDIVLAGKSARFTLAYSAIGLTPDGGATWLLPRLVGLRRAQQLLLLNPTLDAAAAQAEGLVTEVVEDTELNDRAMQLAKQLAAGPSKAYGRLRSLLLESFTGCLEGHLEREAHAIAASGATIDGLEGVAAFHGKRAPHFIGR